MKKPIINILPAFLVIGLILLYLINPFNKQPELNGWYSFVLLGVVLLRAVNKTRKVDVIIRIFGACFYVYLLINYFL